mmetsp:Transcript_11233/g.20631  ORF Transcript_11233/g.20631 Transcript_11233/m.20631 type:complete len:221 (+) Transcript_11233:121-783(+)|eukprot:CAMPEP_0197517860 /NCGR_PEP_ID=MMETSP1318-20131121/2951_1 /TAXON_ID=552666 /ORGANISM="Partenskyella glossopodia, Strain RCC365" /LENGTH=220 /DNA_ID=CAMNT_0043067769 /DNA_START=136 /DNA_END=798 /DNA_ORIENTATION=+
MEGETASKAEGSTVMDSSSSGAHLPPSEDASSVLYAIGEEKDEVLLHDEMGFDEDESKSNKSKRVDNFHEYKDYFKNLLAGVVDYRNNISGQGLVDIMKKCDFDIDDGELQVLLGDLYIYKDDKLHYTELLQFMSKTGMANWVHMSHANEIRECLRNLSNSKSGKLSMEELENSLLDYLPDVISDKEMVQDMLQHMPQKFLKDGNFDYEGYLDQIEQRHY